jgi:hypothetical protein
MTVSLLLGGVFFRPSGAGLDLGIANPRLAPWAIVFRPWRGFLGRSETSIAICENGFGEKDRKVAIGDLAATALSWFL